MSEALYGSIADEAAGLYGIPPWLLRSLITVESGWNPQSIGSAGEVGLMQLKAGAAQDVGMNPADRGNPRSNIFGGARYLLKEFNHTGGTSWCDALEAYNRGRRGASLTKSRSYAERVLGRRCVPGSSLEGAGALPEATPPLDPAQGAQNQAAGEGCAEFGLFSPSTWWPALKCGFQGMLIWILVWAMVLYAALASIRSIK